MKYEDHEWEIGLARFILHWYNISQFYVSSSLIGVEYCPFHERNFQINQLTRYFVWFYSSFYPLFFAIHAKFPFIRFWVLTTIVIMMKHNAHLRNTVYRRSLSVRCWVLGHICRILCTRQFVFIFGCFDRSKTNWMNVMGHTLSCSNWIYNTTADH